MSPLDRIDWLKAIAGDPDLQGTDIRVAVILAQSCRKDIGCAQISAYSIARNLNLHRRSVRRSIEHLAALGYLKIESSQSVASKNVNRYKLVSQSIEKVIHNGRDTAPGVGAHMRPECRRTDAPRVGAHVSPNTGESIRVKKEKTKKERKKPVDKWELPNGIDPDVWNEFEQHRKEIREPLTNLARTKNANVLLKYPMDEQRRIVDKTIANRWTGLFHPKHNGKPYEKGRTNSKGHPEQTQYPESRSARASRIFRERTGVGEPVVPGNENELRNGVHVNDGQSRRSSRVGTVVDGKFSREKS